MSSRSSTAIDSRSPDAASTASGRPLGTLGLSLALYAVLLAAVTLWLPLDSGLTSDDGALAAQAYALRDGTIALERQPATVPVENEGWFNAVTVEEGPIPYPWHPGYAVLLAVTSLGGRLTVGLSLPSVIGAVLAAGVAWRMAESIKPATGPLAFWTAALGPLLIHATAFWGHALGAGLTGLVTYGLLRIGRTTSTAVRRRRLIMVGLVAAAAPLVRSETLPWLAALAIGGWFLWPEGRAQVRRGVLVIVGATSLSYGLERWWVASILDDEVVFIPGTAPKSTGLDVRILSAVRSLVWPTDLGLSRSWTVMITVFVVVALGSVFIRIGRPGQGQLWLVVAAIGYLIRAVVAPIDRIKGFVMAWPVLIVAAVAGGRNRKSSGTRLHDVLVATVGLYFLAVFASQHPGGAGLEWGGRYLSAAIVPLAVLAAVRLSERWPGNGLAIAATLLGPALAGLAVTYQSHQFNLRPVELVIDDNVDAVVSSHRGATRLAWSTLPQAWFVADDENLGLLVERLEAAEIGRIAVVGITVTDPGAIQGYKVVESRPAQGSLPAVTILQTIAG